MTVSPAKIEANRQNAAKSTGPNTQAGKEISRGNSLKHGLTGSGIVGPPDDATKVARLSRELDAEYHPTTPVGRAMLDVAATMFVRLERLQSHDEAYVSLHVEVALADFDAFRVDHADALFDDLANDPEAFSSLMRMPEGTDRLIRGWRELQAIPAWSPADLETASLLAGCPVHDVPEIRGSIDEVIARLEARKAGIDRAPIDRARKRAADLAKFSMEPEAILARRYEAATLRTLDKAIKVLEAEHQPPVGSFGPEEAGEVEPSPAPSKIVPATPTQDNPNPPVDRPRRPDPKKLLEAQRRNRR